MQVLGYVRGPLDELKPQAVIHSDNGASRTDPARGSRRSPPTPANPVMAVEESPAHAANPRVSPLSPEAS